MSALSLSAYRACSRFSDATTRFSSTEKRCSVCVFGGRGWGLTREQTQHGQRESNNEPKLSWAMAASASTFFSCAAALPLTATNSATLFSRPAGAEGRAEDEDEEEGQGRGESWVNG